MQKGIEKALREVSFAERVRALSCLLHLQRRFGEGHKYSGKTSAGMPTPYDKSDIKIHFRKTCLAETVPEYHLKMQQMKDFDMGIFNYLQTKSTRAMCHAQAAADGFTTVGHSGKLNIVLGSLIFHSKKSILYII
jgi:hypothetical protein